MGRLLNKIKENSVDSIRNTSKTSGRKPLTVNWVLRAYDVGGFIGVHRFINERITSYSYEKVFGKNIYRSEEFASELCTEISERNSSRYIKSHHTMVEAFDLPKMHFDFGFGFSLKSKNEGFKEENILKKAFHTFEMDGRKITIGAISFKGEKQVRVGYSVCMVEDRKNFSEKIARIVCAGRAIKKPIDTLSFDSEEVNKDGYGALGNYGILKSIASQVEGKLREGNLKIKGIKPLTRKEINILKKED